MYHLTAPVLYKEVVIGNFAQFFYGVSEPALRNEELPPGQSRICCSISKGVRPYHCLRHPPPAGDHDVTVYTKRQLLGLVQAMYLVYTPQDTIELSKARPDDFDDDQDFHHHLDEVVDIRRYKAVPEAIQSSKTLFPDLNRLVAGAWCRSEWDRPNNANISPHFCGYEVYRAFEQTLAKEMYQITPRYTCKLHIDDGPFRYYPSEPGGVEVNIFHDAELDCFGRSLLPGVLNIVHIEYGSERRSCCPDHAVQPPWQNFLDAIHQAAFTFAEVVNEDWADNETGMNVLVRTYHTTKVRFIIHRAHDYDADTETAAEKLQADADLLQINNALSQEMQDAGGLDNFHGWKDWKAIWIQDYPACPACEPEKYEKMKHLISI